MMLRHPLPGSVRADRLTVARFRRYRLALRRLVAARPSGGLRQPFAGEVPWAFSRGEFAAMLAAFPFVFAAIIGLTWLVSR